jgi:hypothetical protein
LLIVVVDQVKELRIDFLKSSKDILKAITVEQREVVAGEKGLSVDVVVVTFWIEINAWIVIVSALLLMVISDDEGHETERKRKELVE